MIAILRTVRYLIGLPLAITGAAVAFVGLKLMDPRDSERTIDDAFHAWDKSLEEWNAR